MRHALAAGAMFGIVLPIASCVQVLGVEELPAVDAHIAQCGGGVRYADEGCAKCTDAHCCDEANACAGDAACSARIDCMSRCPASDAACRIACGGPSRATPASPEGRFEACRLTHCNVDCLDCGSLGDAWGASCSACLAASCWEVVQGCLADAQCGAQIACAARLIAS